ncbi:DUF805 domain-containing protein [Vreelandella sp. TE19]
MNSSIQSLDTPQGESHSSGYLPRMFQMRGRIGRVRFIAYSASMIVLFWGIVGFYLEVLPLMIENASLYRGLLLVVMVFMAPLAVLQTLFTIRRLNDMNVMGWASLVSLVPMINLFFYLALILSPGSPGDNAYGKPPLPNDHNVHRLLTSLVLIFLLAIVLIGMYSGEA